MTDEITTEVLVQNRANDKLKTLMTLRAFTKQAFVKRSCAWEAGRVS